MIEIFFDCPFGKAEFVCDLLVGLCLLHKGDDLPFPEGETSVGPRVASFSAVAFRTGVFSSGGEKTAATSGAASSVRLQGQN